MRVLYIEILHPTDTIRDVVLLNMELLLATVQYQKKQQISTNGRNMISETSTSTLFHTMQTIFTSTCVAHYLYIQHQENDTDFFIRNIVTLVILDFSPEIKIY